MEFFGGTGGLDPTDSMGGLCDSVVRFSQGRPGPVSAQLNDAEEALADIAEG